MPDVFTAKMEKFCQEYLIDLNATQAAIRAGYSEDSAQQIGSENLSKLVIQERIDELKQEQAEAATITPEFVLKSLKTVAQRTMQGVQVFDSDGQPTGEWKFDSAGANRSLELIGKHLTLFADRVEVSGRNGAPIEFRKANDLSDEELAAIALSPQQDKNNAATSGGGTTTAEASAQ